MNRDTGSPSRTLPSSRSISIATPVTGFDIEAMRNSESVAAGPLGLDVELSERFQVRDTAAARHEGHALAI